MPAHHFYNFVRQDLLFGRAKSGRADLSEKLNQKSRLSLRRVSTVAIYSLATFASGSLAYPVFANETGDINYQLGDFEIREADNFVVEDFTVQSTATEAKIEDETRAIASPELIAVQEFTPIASREPELAKTPSPETATVVIPATASVLPVERSTIKAQPEGKESQGLASAKLENTAPSPPVHTTELAILQSKNAEDLQATPAPKESVKTEQGSTITAQAQGTFSDRNRESEVIIEQLRELEEVEVEVEGYRASPALSIYIPTAYGADRNTGFVSATYQERTRYSDVDDGAIGIGVGLGNARKSVGVSLAYTLASFGSNRDFGSGGFNVKVHRQFANDWAAAVGWNGFLNLGDDNDFEDSVYGVVTKVVRTRDDIKKPLSRVAFTVGVGNGQFRTEDSIEDEDGNINVFGNVALRVAEPVSLITEWSGQDLGVGLSIAPFKNIPFVITPALRDITGTGDGARFVLGSGFAWRF